MAAAKKTTTSKKKPMKPAVIRAKRETFTETDLDKIIKEHTKVEWVFLALVFGYCVARMYKYVGEEIPAELDVKKEMPKLIRKIRAK